MKIGNPKESCKLGEGSACCAYLVCGSEGFECCKDNASMSSLISKRLLAGTMNAKGTGDWKECQIFAEKEVSHGL